MKTADDRYGPDRVTISEPRVLGLPRPLFLSYVLILALLVIGTFNNNWERWGSVHRLWLDTALKSPLKQRPRINLAYAYQREGDYSNAIREYNNALILYPETPGMGLTNELFVSMNLGQLFLRLGDTDRAAVMLLRGWNKAPGHPGIAANLSKLIFESGLLTPRQDHQARVALEVLDGAVRAQSEGGAYEWFRDGDMGTVYLDRALILRFMGRCEEATADFARAQMRIISGGRWLGRDLPIPNIDCVNELNF